VLPVLRGHWALRRGLRPVQWARGGGFPAVICRLFRHILSRAGDPLPLCGGAAAWEKDAQGLPPLLGELASKGVDIWASRRWALRLLRISGPSLLAAVGLAPA
jgi:hypothetical protein